MRNAAHLSERCERRQRAAALDGDGVEVDCAVQAGQDVVVLNPKPNYRPPLCLFLSSSAPLILTP
jgi:hypothetical protein